MGQSRPRLRECGRVLTPYPATPAALVPTQPHQQRCRTPPERLMSQLPRDRVPRNPLTATLMTPLIRLHDPALHHRPLLSDLLPSHLQPELVKAAEASQIGCSEGSVGHVEVFLMGCLGTPIMERPRPLPPAATPLPPSTPSNAKSRYTEPDAEVQDAELAGPFPMRDGPELLVSYSSPGAPKRADLPSRSRVGRGSSR